MEPHTATSSQLKDDIDSGRSGDKVAFPDPAAAPLGTDEEAGGTPTNPQLLFLERQANLSQARPKKHSHSVCAQYQAVCVLVQRQ